MSDQDTIWGDKNKDSYEDSYEASYGKSPEETPSQSGGSSSQKGLVIFILLLSIGIGLAAVLGSGLALRKTEPYTMAFEAAQRNPEVIQALGQPLAMGWPVTGELTLSGISGTVDLSGPIKGPNGRGTLFVAGRKENGVWTFYTLSVRDKRTGSLITIRQ